MSNKPTVQERLNGIIAEFPLVAFEIKGRRGKYAVKMDEWKSFSLTHPEIDRIYDEIMAFKEPALIKVQPLKMPRIIPFPEEILPDSEPEPKEQRLPLFDPDIDDLSLDDFNLGEYAAEYGEAPEVVKKPHWSTLTDGVKNHLDGLDFLLSEILLTAIAMNPRQSSFETMNEFKWETNHYKVIFPILHKLFSSFALWLPYREDSEGNLQTYYDRSSGQWENDSSLPLLEKAHLIVYGPTGSGKSDLYKLSKTVFPVSDTVLTNAESMASVQRTMNGAFSVSMVDDSIRLQNAECVEPLDPETDDEQSKKWNKVLGLGKHPSIIGRKNSDKKNKGVPMSLPIQGYYYFGDMNRRGSTFMEPTIQNALKQSGSQRDWLWRPKAGVALNLFFAFYGEIALDKLSFAPGLGEIFRRSFAVSAAPTYDYKPHWNPTLIQSVDWTGVNDFFEQYCHSRSIAIKRDGKVVTECHSVQFCVVNKKRRYPLAEKIQSLQSSGYLSECLTDHEWLMLFAGTEFSSNAKYNMNQFHLSLAAFILLEFPYLFSSNLSDEEIVEEIGTPDKKEISAYRKKITEDILRDMFRQYYKDFSEMLKAVIRENNAAHNGVAALTIWIQNQLVWMASKEGGELIADLGYVPAEFLSQGADSPFNLYRLAASGKAVRPGLFKDGSPDPSRPGLVYNGNNSQLSKDFSSAVSNLGYSPNPVSGHWELDGK